jgi:hypothetical protein
LIGDSLTPQRRDKPGANAVDHRQRHAVFMLP